MKQQDRLLIGTYTNKQRGGIYLTEFSNGSIEILQHVKDANNPSYLAVHPSKKLVVAVNEGAGADAKLSSYSLHNDQLSLINQVHSGGDHPCYVSIHKSGKWAAVANYTGGNMTVFALNEEGRLSDLLHDIHHEGKGSFLKRQEKPHAHAAVFYNDKLFYTDLGLDKVFFYRFHDNERMPLHTSEERFVETKSGSGPRHIAFHPKTGDMYVMEELSGTVSLFKNKKDQFQFAQRALSTNDKQSEDKGSADIHISPDGRFLYASNRALSNTLTIFSIGKDGKLQLLKHVPTGGEQPRNFVIHPYGSFLLIANQRTDNVVVFNRDIKTGMINKHSEIKIPNPVCLKFI